MIYEISHTIKINGNKYETKNIYLYLTNNNIPSYRTEQVSWRHKKIGVHKADQRCQKHRTVSGNSDPARHLTCLLYLYRACVYWLLYCGVLGILRGKPDYLQLPKVVALYIINGYNDSAWPDPNMWYVQALSNFYWLFQSVKTRHKIQNLLANSHA